MKKPKVKGQSANVLSNHKMGQILLKKKPKKDFQLLYRQRDQSVEQNPIESIIFVKSKACKPHQNYKKIKVQQQFKKIMNDLNAHLDQHKKSQKNGLKNNNSTASSQLKGTLPPKKTAKEGDFMPKKNKAPDREQSAILRTINKSNQPFSKQRACNGQGFKSTKNNQKGYLSPKAKKMSNSKSPKRQKQNWEGKKSPEEKVQRMKSPKEKSQRIRPNNSVFRQENPKRPKSIDNTSPQAANKTQVRRNIKTIPLRVEQYILIDNNFQLIKQKSLFKLQTKLLSTYRNNFKQFQNKLRLKGTAQDNQSKVALYHKGENNGSLLARSQYSSQQIYNEHNEQEEFRFESQQQEQQCRLVSVQKFLSQRILLIQRWWRDILSNKKPPIIIKQPVEVKQQFTGKPDRIIEKPSSSMNFPSAQSIQFYLPSQQDIQNQNSDQLEMLQNQKQMVRQKRTAHQKILNTLFKQQKIDQNEFKNKIILAQQQETRQLKDIQSLCELVKYQNVDQKIEGAKFREDQSGESAFKIIQDRKAINQCEVLQWNQQRGQVQSKDNLDSEEESIQMRIYKIGDKITTQMQSFIQSTRQNADDDITTQMQSFIQSTKQNTDDDKTTTQMQSFTQSTKQNTDDKTTTQTQSFTQQSTSDKQESVKPSQMQSRYQKKRNQQGQQYFQDFQQQLPDNEGSPFKNFSSQNFKQFQQRMDAENHGSSQEANAHFVQMLQQFNLQQEVKLQVDRRISLQMGGLKIEDNTAKAPIDTSILGIHHFLVNFFKFYLYYYKEEFLRFINMPYGYRPEKRLKFMQGYDDVSDDLSEDSDGIIYGLEFIISDDVFEEFAQQYYSGSLQSATQEQKQVIEFSKTHDRALFESFNQALNYFRPYYEINGPPYIWNCSEKALTFYFIAEQNIQEIFEKTQFRILKWASALQGLIVNQQKAKDKNSSEKNIQSQGPFSLEEIFAKYQSGSHPIIHEGRQQRLIKEQRIQLAESMAQWNNTQEHKTSTLYEISSLILQELAQELFLQISIY